MNDKKKQIIQAAIHLFARNDYHSTSIQDIVQLAGVAKGSFYLHFRHKEDLLLAIYEDLLDSYMSLLDEIARNPSLSPKERIVSAVRLNWQYLTEHIDLMSLHMKNAAFFQTDQARDLVCAKAMQVLVWYEQRIIEMYGSQIGANAYECAILINGMFKEYLFSHLYFGIALREEQLPEEVFERLDDLVQGMIRKGTVPLLTSEQFLKCSGASDSAWKARTDLLKDAIPSHVRDSNSAGTLIQALEALTDEVMKEDPNPIIMQGMYNYLLMLSGENGPLTDCIRDLFEGKLRKSVV